MTIIEYAAWLRRACRWRCCGRSSVSWQPVPQLACVELQSEMEEERERGKEREIQAEKEMTKVGRGEGEGN